MIRIDEHLDHSMIEEEALHSIELLLEELGREPSPQEVRFYNAYNKREAKRDEGYLRFDFPISDLVEGMAIYGTYYIRKGSKRIGYKHRILRNSFKLLTALGAKPLGQVITIHHGEINTTDESEQLDDLLTELADYSNRIGLPTLDVVLHESKEFNDFYLINSVVLGSKAKTEQSAFDLTNANLVLLTPAFNEEHYLEDLILSKLFAEIRETENPLVFLISGRKGITGQILKHTKPFGCGVRFFKEGFDGFSEGIDDLLIRRFKTEIVLLAHDPGAIVKLASSYNVEARIIGKIINDPAVQIEANQQVVCNIPTSILHNDLEWDDDAEPTVTEPQEGVNLEELHEPADLPSTAKKVLAKCSFHKRDYALSFFDNTIKSNNISLRFPSDATVIKLQNHAQAIVVSMQSFVQQYDEEYSSRAENQVLDTVHRLTSCGATSITLFGNFNYKNADSSHAKLVGSTCKEAYHKACQKLGALTVGYLENFDTRKQIDHGPQRLAVVNVGIGVIQDTDAHMSRTFMNKGDLIFLIGESTSCANSSVYLRQEHQINDSSVRFADWELSQKTLPALSELIRENIICSSATIGEGGLYAAMVQSGKKNNLGFDITSVADVRDDAFLFGESIGRTLVTLTIHKRKRFIQCLEKHNIPFTILGHVTRGELRVEEQSFGFVTDQ